MKKIKDERAETILHVWLQPRAHRDEILGFREEWLRIRVKAPPSEGEANRNLREVLARTLDVPLTQVEIVSGHKARRKRVRLINVPGEKLAKLGVGAEKAQRARAG